MYLLISGCWNGSTEVRVTEEVSVFFSDADLLTVKYLIDWFIYDTKV